MPHKAEYRFNFTGGWPKGITYEVARLDTSLSELGVLSVFQDLHLVGRIGARLDIDGAAFVEDGSLPDFHDDVEVRRARFYLVGDFRLGLPLAYKFEFSIEGSDVFLNDFYFRWKPPRWVDSVDVGYMTPPMGLENLASSRSLTFMEVGSPIAALAPGFRSGLAAAGHWGPWRLAWALGLFSAGQEQISGDASQTSAQLVGRLAWRPWIDPASEGRTFVHLGLSGSYVFSGQNSIRYRAKPESFIAPFVVDTGDIDADNAFEAGAEVAWIDGPLTFQAEALRSLVADRDGTDRNFGGVYGLVSWIFTGEQRPYNPATGLFERIRPNHPFSFHQPGWGAFEIGQRISWLELTDGSVRGGDMLSQTTGVTWHLNEELKLVFNYVFARVTNRSDDGNVNIFQARIEIGI